MTKKIWQQTEEMSWEEAVTRYLDDHPDFFLAHAELLERLQIPHADSGGAVSLIERQVRVLRDKNQALHGQLRELIEIARENEQLGERVHRFYMSVSDAASLDDVLDSTQDVLRREFKLDAGLLLIGRSGGEAQGRPEFVEADDKRLRTAMSRIGGGRTACLNDLRPELQTLLFGEQDAQIHSVALVPLGSVTPWGVLILGSADRNRFQPDMGTVYLTRLGEVLTQALQRFLS
jgi:uncharacterized protein YigA (DUF484 family)